MLLIAVLLHFLSIPISPICILELNMQTINSLINNIHSLFKYVCLLMLLAQGTNVALNSQHGYTSTLLQESILIVSETNITKKTAQILNIGMILSYLGY